jgi:error-prone DNA polymerase
MPLSEEVVADYQTMRLSLKAHPMSFLRAGLTERGFVCAADLKGRKYRSMIRLAGVVLIRQRPGSAKGVCFITLEDETGVANLVVWSGTMEKYRKVVMGARLIEVRGRVEADEGVIHVIAAHLADATGELHRLSEDLLRPAIAHGDHSGNNLPASPSSTWQPPGPEERDCGFTHGHPRDARIIPKSRDFH